MFLKLSAFFIGIFLIGQILFVSNILLAGHLQPINQYELHYNPAFDVPLNESFQPPFSLQRELVGSMSQSTNIFMDIIQLNTDPSTNGLWMFKFVPDSIEFEITQIPLSNSQWLEFSGLDWIRIVGNTSHFWVLTGLNDLPNQALLAFKEDNNSLLLTDNKLISTEYQVRDGLTFVAHRNIYFEMINIWIWDEYSKLESNEPVYFLTEYSPTTLEITTSIKLPNSFQGKFNIGIETFNEDTVWLADPTSKKIQQYSWEGQLISELTNYLLFELPEESSNFRNLFIQESTFISIKEGNRLTEDIASFYIVPFEKAIRPFPILELVIWVSLSGAGILGLLLNWKRYKKIEIQPDTTL